MVRKLALALIIAGFTPTAWSIPEPGTHAHYLMLTATPHATPPVVAVDVVYGPREEVKGTRYVWWRLEGRMADDFKAEPLFSLRALTSRDPLAHTTEALDFERYILRIHSTTETLEYRDIHTGRALLPAWFEFERHFVPRPTRATHYQRGVPESCEYLGQILTLKYVGHGVEWKPWEHIQVLDLDRELLVGTGRNFKDAEGRRLPQKPEKHNYTFVDFKEDDYRIMIEAGINLFTVKPEQEKWVRAEPVFYLRGVGGDPVLSYPTDLYRSNYLGSVMFMDEPTIIMTGDKLIHNILRYFSDAAALIERRVHARYNASGNYGAYHLEKALVDRGVNFGDMRLMQWDYPSWETIFETAHYQLAGGLNGIVHEGRYQLEAFDKDVERFTGKARNHTAEELLRYHFAFLRGAARRFGKHWGTSIYGQADPALSPRAVTLAYDMGARYVWFWTSDHDHHLPWPEQLELARILKAHKEQHPRPSVFGTPPKLDTVIVIPDGYFLSLRNLWWVRVLDPEGKNEAARQYRRLMARALAEVHKALDRGEEFDITVDDGRPIIGYRNVVRISGEE